MQVTVYGIKTCSSVRNFVNQLRETGKDVVFYDYLSQGVSEDLLRVMVNALGWEQVINHKARNLAKLDDDTKTYLKSLTGSAWEPRAFEILVQEPRIIKRPIVQEGDSFTIGNASC